MPVLDHPHVSPSAPPPPAEATRNPPEPGARPIDAAAIPNVRNGVDVDRLADELDRVRAEVLASLGPDDERYIRRLVMIQRRLELAGRALLWAGVAPPAWIAGVGALSLAKILENMEIGHNVLHGQWDWLGDPDINSRDWDWDNVCPADQWQRSHNEVHHQWTNVRGRDGDIGYGLLRVDPDQPWSAKFAAQPLAFVALATLFEYGVAFHDVDNDLRGINLADDDPASRPENIAAKAKSVVAKIRRQAVKDYVAFPLLSLPFGPAGVAASAGGAAVANIVRNVWAFTVIFCGHFPDGTHFTDAADAENETDGEWYLRQIQGSANFEGGPLLHLLAGNLSHQIEHHLFPDVPSRRYREIAPRVREICDGHGIDYNTGSLATQFGRVVRRVLRLWLPR